MDFGANITLVNKLRLCLANTVHFCLKKIIVPKSEKEDDRRHEFILNVILLGIIILVFIEDTVLLYNALTKGSTGVSFTYFTSILVTFVALLVLSRWGYFKFVSYILISILFAAITHVSYRFGVSLPSALLGYALVIMISSALVSSKFGVASTLFIFVTMLLLGHREIGFGKVATWKLEMIGFSDVITYAVILFLITLISWISNHEIEKSLKRARTSEEELKHERDSLEIKVEERTRDLKMAELDKMSQLYRFAEFGKLSSGIFHDLMNPLTAINLNINELKNASDPNARKIQSHLKRAISASTRMENYIATVRKQLQVHDVHRIFNLNHEIEEAITIHEFNARKAGVTIQFEADKKLHIYGNPLRFHQIITNLISNAIDSYESILKTYRPVNITLKKNDKNVILTVYDEGHGIPHEITETIFEPFYTTKSIHNGTGLGLSTTKTIIERDFNGTITVISDVDAGATFTVTIPIIHEKQASTS